MSNKIKYQSLYKMTLKTNTSESLTQRLGLRLVEASLRLGEQKGAF